jgi:hypothetical protein
MKKVLLLISHLIILVGSTESFFNLWLNDLLGWNQTTHFPSGINFNKLHILKTCNRACMCNCIYLILFTCTSWVFKLYFNLL